MKIKILCTLGPASLRHDVIQGLDALGVDLFRINLSHTRPEAIEPAVGLVRQFSSIPICLDTHGAQVRCGVMANGVTLEAGSSVRLTASEVVGTEVQISLWPSSVFAELRVGNQVRVDFNGVLLQIEEIGDGWARAAVLKGGRVGSNKAVNIDPAPQLPPIADRDAASIGIGLELGIRNFALSFASCAADVEMMRNLLPKDATLISKIESRAGVRNRDDIINFSDAVLIDRGDLSREIPLAYVPYYQKAIVRQANRWNRPAYVATNLLESMVTNHQPTIAEMNDIANTLLDGVHGLVLAAETAVGVDPVGSVETVLASIRAFEHTSMGAFLEEDRLRPVSDAGA
jgi:sulfate adenylyltransferase